MVVYCGVCRRNYILLININLKRGKARKLRCQLTKVPKRKIHLTRKYTRAARTNHYKRPARLRNSKLLLERKNGTPLPFQLNVLYFLRSAIARTNLEHSRRLLPAPPLRPAISFLGKNEVTKLQSRLVSNRPR